MNRDPEVLKLVELARAQGWTVEATKKGHVRFVPPKGRIVIASGTTSDNARSRHNLRADLRRAGLEVP